MTLSRIIVHIDLHTRHAPQRYDTVIDGVPITIHHHAIGWDFNTARELIQTFDGKVSAISLSGFYPSFDLSSFEITHREAQRLGKLATKTPLLNGSHLRRFSWEWTMGKLLRTRPRIFNGQRTLLHAALATPGLAQLDQAGAEISAADLLTFLRIPKRIEGYENLIKIMRGSSPLISFAPHRWFDPSVAKLNPNLQSRFRNWIRDCDIFVSFAGMLDFIGTPEILKGKTLIVDTLTPEWRHKLEQSQLANLLVLMPEFPDMNELPLNSFALAHAVLDVLRQEADSDVDFDEFLLQYIDKKDLHPNALQSLAPSITKCAFIVHPLDRQDLFRAKAFRWMQHMPEQLQYGAEKLVSNVPAFHYGTITGIKSKATNQEVICEVYALPATPKLMREMDVEDVYKQLIKTAVFAKEQGCSIIGLGAYTKVIGDAGLTVSKHTPIPVTNGNSYSASATLWAAKEMVFRLGFIDAIPGTKRMRGKAMVIGATGSIGRVSAYFLSLVYTELVLVAPRPERLLTIRDEIKAMSPEVELSVRTDPNTDLPDTDLVVIATSSPGGSVLDINQVQPGAVICDCSRPLDISPDEARQRPDVLVIESGEIDLPGVLSFGCDIGLPYPSVYACLAETVLLAFEERFENYSVGKELSLDKVKEIYQLGLKHGARLSAVRGPLGFINDADIERTRAFATERRKRWTMCRPGRMPHLADRKADE